MTWRLVYSHKAEWESDFERTQTIMGEWSDSLIDKVIDDIKSTESQHTKLRLILEFLPEPIRDALRVKAK